MSETGVYRVQRGDSALLVAKKLVIAQGKKPTNANIQLQAKKLVELTGSKDLDDFNKRFFSSVGLEIPIGESIKTSQQPKPQGNSPIEETEEEPEVQQTTAPKRVSQMNNVEHIKKDIIANGGKPVEISFDKLNSKEKIKVQSYMNLFNDTTPTIIKDKNSGEIHVYMNTLNTNKGHKIKMQSLNIKIDDKETTVTRYYRNGKIAQDIENNFTHLSKSKLIQGPYKKQGAKKVITEPLPIDIKLNTPIYDNATPEQKKSIDKFLGSLTNQKADLMKELGIDNDTYNRFAKLAVVIGMRETKLGTAKSYEYWDDSAMGYAIKDSAALINAGLKKIGLENPIKKFGATSVSKGITQIKVGDWIENPRIRKLFNKYGITSGYYKGLTEEQSAAAAIIIINELDKIVKKPEYQEGIEAANMKYYAVDKELDEDGKIVRHKTKQWKLNKVTNDDAILYLYNGRAGVLKNGNATPKDNAYIANMHRDVTHVKIYENKAQREEALKHAKYVTPDESASPARSGNLSKDLGWGIGQVAFATNLYSSGIEKNTDEEIKNLKASLKAKGVNAADIKSLVQKMENGDIAFVKGLTKKELNAMTDDDVKLLIQHSDKLNKKLETLKLDSTKRKYAFNADRNFKRAYLSSHAERVKLSTVKKYSVKLNKSSDTNVKKYPAKGYYTGAQRRCEGLLPQLRGERVPDAGYENSQSRINKGKYTGFRVEKDKGINQANASATDLLLAKNGADAANTLRTNGACLTGVKQALIGAGAVTVDEMKTFNKAFQLAGFLSSHPERFTEITHIQISPKMAREITAGDLTSLPAGCIVVFGNKERGDVDGHSGITSGNGQIYSDEIDNSNWDNFVSDYKNQNGKGEHGYIRVFRLNPAYFTTDETGKKLIKK